MDPQNAPESRAPGATDAALPVRTRAVVALVRPCTPNAGVITAAADLAAAHGCALLLLGTLEPLTAEWVDGADIAGPMLEAAHGELFATCVEQLWDRDLVWGVNVLWGSVASEMLELSRRVDVVRVVRGSRRKPTLLRRLRRRITGRLDRSLASLDLVTA